MESSSIQFKVISGKGLKAFNFFQKLSVYALVSIFSDDPNKKLGQNQQQRTATDKEGDGNPEWNHGIRFDLDETSFEECDHLFAHFDLRSAFVFGDKTIGEVRVPFKDLIDESNRGVVRFVSYEVRTTDGKPNGVLNFSYKVNSKGNKMGAGAGAGAGSLATKIDGFSIVHDHHHHNPSPEGHYPIPEVQSPPSSQVHYPSLEWQNPSLETYSAAPQGVHYHHSPGVQHISHQTNLIYPPPEVYHPPPPPLLPPPPPVPLPWLHQPPVHGAFYHPHRPGIYPWAPDPHEFAHGGPAVGQFDRGPGGFGAGREVHPYSWNGR